MTRPYARRQALILGGGLALSGLTAARAQEGGPMARLKALGIELPRLSPPLGTYAPYARDGRLLFISGQLPMLNGKPMAVGRVPTDVAVEAAQAAARQCAINILAAATLGLDGDLGKIESCLKVTGYVACEPGFGDQPKIINGASDLIGAVFGEKGRHARAAVGVASLPLNATVEVDAVFALRS
ncbi:MAG: RidA family protein [Pseudomonadota bacterium]